MTPRPQRQAEIFRVTDQAKKAITTPATTITVPAGAIGDVVAFQIPIFPVLNVNGSAIGGDGDSSLTIGGTVFTDQVPSVTADADLTNGQFWVDHMTGEARGKKANSGTSLSWTWKHFASAGSNSSGVETFAISSGAAQARSTETTAASDAYVTMITVAAEATHMLVSLDGSNDAILSLDNGVTEFCVIKAGAVYVFDNLTIAAAAVIRAKNKTAGLNFTTLNVSIW